MEVSSNDESDGKSEGSLKQVDAYRVANREAHESPKKKITSLPPIVSMKKKRETIEAMERETSPKIRPAFVKSLSADTGDQANYEFYSDRIVSQPDGARISVIHQKWAQNYDLLESHHGYIQWLFPLHEDNGVNHLARKLTKWEASRMIEDEVIAGRILQSYK